MSLDGSWDIRITTPMGVNKMTLDLTDEAGTITGTAHTMGGDAAVQEGAFDGGRLTFAVQVAAPFPMRLDMTLDVDGDTVHGQSKTGAFPPAPVEGERKA